MSVSREELKRMWLSIPHGKQSPPERTIVVRFDKYEGRKGQGTVTITRDGDGGFSQFSTHQVKPIEYVLNKMKDKCDNRLEYDINYDYSKYRLIIK